MAKKIDKNVCPFKEVMDNVRIDTMEGSDIQAAVRKHALSVLAILFRSPDRIGLSCTTGITFITKDTGEGLLIVRGLAQPGRHKVVCYTDSADWEHCLIQIASDVEAERIEWKADEPRDAKPKRSSFIDDIAS